MFKFNNSYIVWGWNKVNEFRKATSFPRWQMDKDAKHTVESHDNLRLKLVSQWYASIDFPKRQAYFLLHDWTLGEAPENK